MSSHEPNTTDTERNREIATIIAEQMGGTNRLTMFTGAYNFAAIDNGLMFRMPGKGLAKDSINVVRVTLTPMDEYDMEFLRLRGTTLKEIRAYRGVYCDQLMDLFEEATGLYLTFHPRNR